MHPAEARNREDKYGAYVEEAAADEGADLHLPHFIVKAVEKSNPATNLQAREGSYKRVHGDGRWYLQFSIDAENIKGNHVRDLECRMWNVECEMWLYQRNEIVKALGRVVHTSVHFSGRSRDGGLSLSAHKCNACYTHCTHCTYSASH